MSGRYLFEYIRDMLGELVRIRCLLEGLYLDCREAREEVTRDLGNKGCTLQNIKERAEDIIKEKNGTG